jgi:SAM-dependent methyltransferase
MALHKICSLCGHAFEEAANDVGTGKADVCPDCLATKTEITEAYDAISNTYAEKYQDEILLKPKVQSFIADFVKDIPQKGLICDMGCGPGQVARYLKNSLGRNSAGVDLSPKMIEVAAAINPGISFKCADVLQMQEAGLYDGIIGLYFIVNFPPSQLTTLFRQLKSLLTANGKLLLSFHIGDDILNRVESLWDSGKPCNFYFFKPETVAASLTQAGFKVNEIRFREPDLIVEYNSQRAYIFC